MAFLRCLCLPYTDECDKVSPVTDGDEGPSVVRVLLPWGTACQEPAVLGAGGKISGPVMPVSEVYRGSATEGRGPGHDQLEFLAVPIRCDESAKCNTTYQMSIVRLWSIMGRLYSRIVCRS